MTYYPRLKDLREDNDLTQEEVAKILNTTYQYYNKYETGKIPITFERAIILAKYYKVSLDYIAGMTNNKNGVGYSRESKTEIKQQNNAQIINLNVGDKYDK